MTLQEYFALAHGNLQRLAEAIGAHGPDISRWATGVRNTPLKYAAAIERATGGAVTRKDLFPDTWASIWPELVNAAPAAGADEPLRPRMLQLAGEVAAAKEQAARDAAEIQRLRSGAFDMNERFAAATARKSELERQVLTLLGPASAPARVEGASSPAGLICELATQDAVFVRKLADLQQRGYHVLGHILHKDGEYALMDGSCRWLTRPQYQRLMHEQDGSLFGTPAGNVDDPLVDTLIRAGETPADARRLAAEGRATVQMESEYAAELRAAILQTRAVFASEPAAADALNYLESVLAVRAQTGCLAARPSLFEAAKDLLTWIEAKHRPPTHDHCGTMALVRLDALATLADAVVDEEARRAAAGGGTASTTKETRTSAGETPVAGAARQAASTTSADQAASAMAAESAQLAADAERSIAARAEPLTLQQVDKIEDRMVALLAEPLTREQRELVRTDMVAEFRALNAMGVQPLVVQP